MCNQGNAQHNLPAKKDVGDSLRLAETLPWVHTPAGVFFGSEAPMPSRIIRESCRTSPTLAQLSHGAERLFWRLTTIADDYGRFEADPRILKGSCFSVVDSVTIGHCRRWLEEMIKADLVLTYNINGKEYGYFLTWSKHQRKRPSKSKYPDPPQLAATRGESPQPAAVVIGYGEGVKEKGLRGMEPGVGGAGGRGNIPPRSAHALSEEQDRTRLEKIRGDKT